MIREEATKMLKYNSNVIHQTINGETDHKEVEALEMAIKALEQQPCEDTISRQATIDQTYLWSKDEFLRVTNPFDYLRKRIKSLPSVKPQESRWIPVSERLPDNNDDVLVWIEYIKDDYDCAWWGMAYYSLQYKKWVVDTNGYNPIVKAWMPLPEPYKADNKTEQGLAYADQDTMIPAT